MDRGEPRWFEPDASTVSQKSLIAAGLSLGIFLFALESDRLSALVRVDRYDSMPLLGDFVPIAFLGVCVACLCRRPTGRPVPAVWTVVAALACSLGLAGMYCQAVPSVPSVLQVLPSVLYSISTPVLVFCWVQRAMPFGRVFVVKSFGIGAVVLGCLSMLTMVFEHPIGLVLAMLLPFAGIAVLPMVAAQGASSGVGFAGSSERWNALAVIGKSRTHADVGTPLQRRGAVRTLARSLLRLAPFLCYAVIFGNIHFSWVGLQDDVTVGVWVQLGASAGSMLCGLAAFALARLHWGRALESILNLFVVAAALVALWLSTFLTSGDVFAYLVLLNVAQKLTFLLMLLFGFPFARDGAECASLWALAYFSFFVGTCVSSLVGTYAAGALNVVAAVTLAVVFVADMADIVLLYGGDSSRGARGAPVDGPGLRAFEGESFAAEPTERHAPEASARMETQGHDEPARLNREGLNPDALAYACHLIARRYDLTRREEEVLRLLVRGRSAARVAEALCISVATARTHQRNIYAKMGVHNQQDVLDVFDRYTGKAESEQLPDRESP